MTPEVLEGSGFVRKLGMLPMAPTAPTRRSPTSSLILDYFVLGAGVARLMSGAQADMQWDFKPRRPGVMQVRPDALSVKQLICRSYVKLPTALPFGPCPAPGCWAGALHQAAHDVALAQRSPADGAWATLNAAWATFID
eukprot:4716183-Pyramimonas_sp.AAC.1